MFRSGLTVTPSRGLRSGVSRSAKWRRTASTSRYGVNGKYLQIAEEVREAIESNRPVVALETAIYTHGFPKPENVALASRLESVVRVNGGVPATVGVLDGIAHVGLQTEDLIRLANAAGHSSTRKVSRRDLSYVCSQKLHGGTTVSGTMMLAKLAGIQVFATGGLGGVHRGDALDISADLTELGRTQIAVVCSGCKGFLDIPRTLEYLETQGVGVLTFADGREGNVDFPAFWARDSGIKSPMTIRDEADAAAAVYVQEQMAVESGLVLANPIPASHSTERSALELVIEQALTMAQERGSSGNENTPYVLAAIRELTQGKSVTANSALVEANVERATKVASELCCIRAQQATLRTPYHRTPLSGESRLQQTAMQLHPAHPSPAVIVAGSLAVDFACDFVATGGITSTQPKVKTSNPAKIAQTLGGVGRNVATASQWFGASTELFSLVGNDVAGTTAIDLMRQDGLSTHGIYTAAGSSRTAQYVAVNDSEKNLVLGMADMDILDRSQTVIAPGDWPDSVRSSLSGSCPKWIVIDANWDSDSIRLWSRIGRDLGAKIAFEPVSVVKSRRLFARGGNEAANRHTVWPKSSIDLATPNSDELQSMFLQAKDSGLMERDDWFSIIESFSLKYSGSWEKLIAFTNPTLVDQGVPQQSLQLLPFIPCIITTLGEQGLLLTQIIPSGDPRLHDADITQHMLSRSTGIDPALGGIYMRHFPPPALLKGHEIASCNGVGDTLLGVLISALTQRPSCRVEDCIDVAQRASIITLQSALSVGPEVKNLGYAWKHR